MNEILKRLLDKNFNNDILPALTQQEISSFEKTNHIKLPDDLKELLTCFDGGEILVPGPTLFGVNFNSVRKTIKEANGKNSRCIFSIPNNYLIIAKTNYGDLICIDLNSPHKVVQWDHEHNEPFCDWNTLTDWLNDAISSYEKFEEENK